jgi:hypothetical protein
MSTNWAPAEANASLASTAQEGGRLNKRNTNAHRRHVVGARGYPHQRAPGHKKRHKALQIRQLEATRRSV